MADEDVIAELMDDAIAEDLRPAARGGLRQRTRALVITEIRQAARSILAEHGPRELTVRQVSRELGISAPSVYRYFKNHQDLVDYVVVDVFTEVIATVRTAVEEAGPDTPAKRLSAASWRLRTWAVEHPHEFGLALVTPLGPDTNEHVQKIRWRFAGLFVDLFDDVYRAKPFPVPPLDDLPPALREVATTFRLNSGLDIPFGDEVLVVFLRNWVRLYGAVSMEAMGQLRNLGDPTGALFRAELDEMDVRLGF